MNRHTWVLVHRYAGLYMALFLFVAGLTGSLLAFLQEINDWLDPPPSVQAAGRVPLDPLVLREKALERVPGGLLPSVDLHPDLTRAQAFYFQPATDAATGKPHPLETQAVVLDPYDGTELQRLPAVDPEAWPWWPLTRGNLMGFVYALHYSLALPGSWGVWLFGIAALLWTIDCVVSVILTLPLARRAGEPRRQPAEWLRRWRPSWQVRLGASAWRLNFDLHRAGGLWTWAMLFVFAWSSVAFNLGEQVYTPVMSTLFGMDDPLQQQPKLAAPREQPLTPMPEALARARALMARHGADLPLRHESSLYFDGERGLYLYATHTGLDISDHGGQTLLLMDDASGDFRGLVLPSGQNGGRTFTNWLLALHMAALWGLPMKIFVCAMGLLVALLSATGVYLWLKKRAARRVGRARQALAGLKTAPPRPISHE